MSALSREGPWVPGRLSGSPCVPRDAVHGVGVSAYLLKEAISGSWDFPRNERGVRGKEECPEV